MNHDQLLGYCYAKAQVHNPGGRQRLWAVAVDKKGNIIAEQGNSYTQTHPMQSMYAKAVGLGDHIFLHAEISLIISLYKKHKKCYSVYIARARRNGTPGSAKPCVICEAALKEAGIENVYWTE